MTFKVIAYLLNGKRPCPIHKVFSKVPKIRATKAFDLSVQLNFECPVLAFVPTENVAGTSVFKGK